LGPQGFLHRVAVEFSIRLTSGALNSGAFTAIQDPELYASLVSDPPHNTVKGVNFPNQMPLPQSTDGGVAGHFSYGFQLVGDKQRLGPHAGCGCGRFTSCMATAHDDNIPLPG